MVFWYLMVFNGILEWLWQILDGMTVGEELDYKQSYGKYGQ